MGGDVYVVGMNRRLYWKRNLRNKRNNWQYDGGYCTQISMGQGHRLFCNQNGIIYTKTKKWGHWKRVPGWVHWIASNSAGQTVAIARNWSPVMLRGYAWRAPRRHYRRRRFVRRYTWTTRGAVLQIRNLKNHRNVDIAAGRAVRH